MRPSLFPPPSLNRSHIYDGLRVGLFGGSFNPAHEAHQQLALRALQALDLDVVWWMVSPQNPLKSTDNMAPLADRMASVHRQMVGPHMIATDIEAQMGTQYTADSIAQLRQLFPRTHFTWMMGADSFRTFHQWDNWQSIPRMVPMAIFARPPQQLRSLTGFAAQTLRQYRVQRLTGAVQEWRYVMMPLNPLSATEIRNQHAR